MVVYRFIAPRPVDYLVRFAKSCANSLSWSFSCYNVLNNPRNSYKIVVVDFLSHATVTIRAQLICKKISWLVKNIFMVYLFIAIIFILRIKIANCPVDMSKKRYYFPHLSKSTALNSIEASRFKRRIRFWGKSRSPPGSFCNKNKITRSYIIL